MQDAYDKDRVQAAITRQAAIDEKRAIAAKQLNRYDQVENGWDPDNQVEITTVADVDRIQAEIASNLDTHDMTLIHRVGAEMWWQSDTMARTDGNASNERLVCVPAVMWSSKAYGVIVLIKAHTIAA